MLLYQAKKSLLDRLESGDFALKSFTAPGGDGRRRGDANPHDNVWKLAFEAKDGTKLNAWLHDCEVVSAVRPDGSPSEQCGLIGATLRALAVCGMQNGIWNRPVLFCTGAELEGHDPDGATVRIALKGGRA